MRVMFEWNLCGFFDAILSAVGRNNKCSYLEFKMAELTRTGCFAEPLGRRCFMVQILRTVQEKAISIKDQNGISNGSYN